MPLDPSFAGRSYPPAAGPAFQVGREKIREFAEAIGDDSPLHHDLDAAQAAGYGDLVAPPTFLMGMTLDACGVVIDDPELGLEWSRVVHGDQRFVFHRPVVAGDELRVTVIVESIRSMAGNDMLGLRAEVATDAGEPVATTYSLLVARAEAS